MPWDRTWAVAHEQSKATNAAWARCRNFIRVAGAPQTAAITAKLDEATETLSLSHPERPDLTFAPDREPQAFLDWIAPLMPEGRAQPSHFVRVPGRGLTDSDFPSVSLCNPASHRAVEGRVGRPMSIHRWRGNIWIDGLGPWEEFEWLDREVQIGAAVLRVRERTERCETTAANPETGKRDENLLAALDSWGHRDFSVLAQVTRSGRVAVGDTVQVL